MESKWERFTPLFVSLSHFSSMSLKQLTNLALTEIIWTEYFCYRIERRTFDIDLLEKILRFSSERYYDVETDRSIVVGKHKAQLVVIPYEHSSSKMMNYFKEEDVLHLLISEEAEAGSVEISPNVTAELNQAGELVGVEIINASTYLRDSILESVQGKLLSLTKTSS